MILKVKTGEKSDLVPLCPPHNQARNIVK